MRSERKSPTMADVAREAGVSSMTVSRAYRPGSPVNAETREAIIAAAERLGYVFDSTAAGLSSRRTGFVAVTIPSINNANFADTVRGLTDGLGDSRLQVLLGYTNYDLEQEERLVRQLLTRRPEAIVLTGGRHTDACRRLLVHAGIPVLETWDAPADPVGSVAGFSNAEAGAMLVRHLVDTGRRRIGFLGGDATRDTRGLDRRRGYIASMAAQGLEAHRLVEAGPPPVSMREGAEAMAALVRRWPDTDAVICVSDLAAFGALTECQRLGIAVPEQIAICGFGAYELAEVSIPAITTVDPHCYDLGRIAASHILGLLSDPSAAPSITTLQPTLMIQASTSVA